MHFESTAKACVRYAAQRCGCRLAARGARAADGDVEGRNVTNRIPLGGGPFKPDSRISSRSSQPARNGDLCKRTGGSRSQGRDTCHSGYEADTQWSPIWYKERSFRHWQGLGRISMIRKFRFVVIDSLSLGTSWPDSQSAAAQEMLTLQNSKRSLHCFCNRGTA